ncbi:MULTISPECIES: beta-ketoacyl synthase [unclassified Imperialibacter]|uniref:beta-ketoacyl-[acyl-carrier-protein] synthase family protein n=1 Tax=unclassified Imperialibacter TaxID=2629706 RepID=UPI001250D566|nr:MULTISPECIES: beta-ketoacyl-[acyl-carrier-protein] synthase family protein [unclassified Imperialibacter]CAD5255019.1 3-oxoacyl-(Acyl-carrier-protein) synthase [Imperialibacter sp. 89]CAD5256377.1 3-oxoacyl-(Acyl-carrier-protein) synthase [Imperialibacter sp. 75]VVT20307.1 Beta-ketoacyl-ACP synthase [Imperialibacter sp. EC-SDR9]
MSLNKRVVITGLGVVAPNATGKEAFEHALRGMKSGITRIPTLAEHNLGCQIAGEPEVSEEYKLSLLPQLLNKMLDNHGVIYGCLSGLEAWKDAGLTLDYDKFDPELGIIYGGGALSMDESIGPRFDLVNAGQVKKLGTKTITQSMNSGVSAYLNGMLGAGNRVMSNSSACSTGTEAAIMGYELIKSGKAKRMLCGSSEGKGKYIWGAFDSMRVLCRDSNDNPTFGSRPMSSTSSGFVPGAGGGALVLEELDTALARGARIYAEILGGDVNSGGQRMGGSMTAPNSTAVQACIKNAIKEAGVTPESIDLISGHLTSTMADPIELNNWVEALNVKTADFPLVNATKSMIGHCIAGAGSIELVGCALQMHGNFVHGNLNIEELHPEILKIIPTEKIPTATVETNLNIIAKANFGFGDVNSCIILRKFSS